MSEQIVNAFVMPAKSIWEAELGHSLDLKRAESITSSVTTEDVSVYISVDGDAPGIIIYGFSSPTARRVAGTMMGQELRTLNEMAHSALAELANIITVRASAELSSAGTACAFGAPLVLHPAGVPIQHMTNPHLRATLASDLGNLNIHIGLSNQSKDTDVDWLMQRWR